MMEERGRQVAGARKTTSRSWEDKEQGHQDSRVKEDKQRQRAIS